MNKITAILSSFGEVNAQYLALIAPNLLTLIGVFIGLCMLKKQLKGIERIEQEIAQIKASRNI